MLKSNISRGNFVKTWSNLFFKPIRTEFREIDGNPRARCRETVDFDLRCSTRLRRWPPDSRSRRRFRRPVSRRASTRSIRQDRFHSGSLFLEQRKEIFFSFANGEKKRNSTESSPHCQFVIILKGRKTKPSRVFNLRKENKNEEILDLWVRIVGSDERQTCENRQNEQNERLSLHGVLSGRTTLK